MVFDVFGCCADRMRRNGQREAWQAEKKIPNGNMGSIRCIADHSRASGPGLGIRLRRPRREPLGDTLRSEQGCNPVGVRVRVEHAPACRVLVERTGVGLQPRGNRIDLPELAGIL